MSTNSTSSGLSSATTSSPWIVGPLPDLALFVATPVLILPLVMLARRQFSDQAIYGLVASLGATGHHLPGMLRAYGDRALFRRFRLRLTVAPILLLAISIPLLYSDLKQGMAVLLAVWGLWHGMMQVYGFLRIYDAKTPHRVPDNGPSRIPQIDWLMCLAWFGAGVVYSDGRIFLLLDTLYRAGVPLIPPPLIEALRITWLIGTVLITVVFLGREWMRRAGWHPATGIKLLSMSISFAFWWYAMVMVDNIIVGVAIFEIFHDVQYLGIVWVFNRRRAGSSTDAGQFTRWLFRRSAMMVIAYVGLVAAYGLGTQLPGRLGAEAIQEFMVAVIWTSTMLHFYFDGFIWKVRESSTRAGLGLDSAAPNSVSRPMAPGLVHGLKWTPLFGTLGLLAFSQWWSDFVFSDQVARDQQIRARYENLVEVTPRYDHAHVTLGKQLRIQGHLSQAETSLSTALTLSGDQNTDAHFELALLKANFGLLEEVIPHHRAVLAREPTRSESHLGLGLVLQSLKRPEEAETHLSEAIRLDPTSAAAHIGVARLAAEQRNSDRARSHLQEAISILGRASDPSSADRQLLQSAERLLDRLEPSPATR